VLDLVNYEPESEVLVDSCEVSVKFHGSNDDMLSPGEAARMLGVATRTIADWDRRGLIHSVRTAGGHRRYLAREIYELLGRTTI